MQVLALQDSHILRLKSSQGQDHIWLPENGEDVLTRDTHLGTGQPAYTTKQYVLEVVTELEVLHTQISTITSQKSLL